VLVAGKWMWQAFGGRPEREWVALGLTVAFVPTFVLLTGGQLTGLALFGFAGFLRFRPTSPALAGCLGALTAGQPHLFGLFAVALLLDALRAADGRKVVVRGAAVLLALSLAALAADSCAFGQYLAALSAPASDISKSMADYPSPVLGVMLRDAIPNRPGAAVFLPLNLAALWLATHRGRDGVAAGHLPWLRAAALVVRAYRGGVYG